jgi:hypothetical protein
MTPEEHAEFRRWETEHAALREQVPARLAELQESKGRLDKDRHHSRTPPSSDGLKRPPRSLR